jgi:hypothetical protein
MKHTLAGIAAIALLAVTPLVSAANITIDFETPPSFQPIGDFYGGGAGPNLGVTFGLDALAIQNDALGPYFANAPSPIGVMAPVGSAAAMNVPGGFGGTVSFSYSTQGNGTIGVYSGLDASGMLLASFPFVANSTNCPTSPGTGLTLYCNWNVANLSFSGIARSIGFGAGFGDGTLAAFDNVRINSVPEPASVTLIAAILAGLGLRRWARGATPTMRRR